MNYLLIRRMVQLFVLFLIIFFTYFYLPLPATVDWLCPVWHFQTLVGGNLNFLYLGTAWRPPEINFLWALAVLVLSAVILGRVFCGWVCPFGFLLELSGKISSFFRKNKKSEKSKAAAFQRVSWLFPGIKYLTFLAVLILAYFWREALFCYICPAGGIFRAMIGFYTPLPLVVLGIVFISVLVLGMKVWCRYLCPLGGGLSLLAFKQVFRLRKQGKCESCGQCLEACPVDIDLEEEFRQGELSTSDCLMCFRCLEACPKKILKFP